MKRKDNRTELQMRLDAECLRRSKFGSCRMECELQKEKPKYCKEVWQASKK